MGAQCLTAHPSTPCAAIECFSVAITPHHLALQLEYRIDGQIDALRFAPPRSPQRTDGLWHHSCCELFLRPAAGPAYREFNFSPSGEWAAYAFSAYRQSMQSLPLPGTPRIAVRSAARHWTLSVELPWDPPACASPGAWRVGLCAVIETGQGALSYWAARHGGARPDFHHADSFIAWEP